MQAPHTASVRNVSVIEIPLKDYVFIVMTDNQPAFCEVDHTSPGPIGFRHGASPRARLRDEIEKWNPARTHQGEPATAGSKRVPEVRNGAPPCLRPWDLPLRPACDRGICRCEQQTGLNDSQIATIIRLRELRPRSLRRASGPAPKTRSRGSPSLRNVHASAGFSRLETSRGSIGRRLRALTLRIADCSRRLSWARRNVQGRRTSAPNSVRVVGDCSAAFAILPSAAFVPL